MDTKDLLKDEKETNIVPFRPSVITGGMDGNGPWLFNVPVGSMIAVRDRKNLRNFVCPVFTVLQKSEKTVRLVNPDPKNYYDARVDPYRFINDWDFVEIIGTIDLSTVGKEDTDGEVSE